MRKIIGFKLSLKAKELQRRAKKAKVDLAGAGLDEAGVQGLLDGLSKSLKPAVLFDTFSHPDAEQPLLSPMPGLAYSLILATLGEVSGAPEAVWPVIRDMALDECVRFASALIEDEAAKDSCELSPITPLSDSAALEAAVKKLDGAKIGVSAAEGRLSPEASAAVSLSWLAKSKAKKGK